jgi:hypothetical protein
MSASTLTLRSARTPRGMRALSLLVPVFTLALAGCGEDDPPAYDPVVECNTDDPEVTEIDRDGLLELDTGHELAVGVEYTGDGAYRIAMVCDSDTSGYGCLWDVLATSVDGTIDSFAGEELERQDFLASTYTSDEVETPDAVRILTFTEGDVDAFTLQTTPGSTLRLEAYLDVKYCAGPYLYWFSGGEVRNSSSTVTEFTPVE